MGVHAPFFRYGMFSISSNQESPPQTHALDQIGVNEESCYGNSTAGGVFIFRSRTVDQF